MAATSINIQPIKAGSELHNKRVKALDYVRAELTHLNESWQLDTVQSRLESIKEKYKRTTGQAMQKKATPIREGVIVISKSTTMDQLQEFAQKAEQRFGIKAIQIHMHKDEGHQGSQEWKPNLHAHIVFDWTQDNGKSCKLNRQHMAELQTLLSQSLKMERGQSSDLRHLDAIQYKNDREKERLEKIKQDVSKLETKKSVKSTILKASEKIKGFMGQTVNDKEKIVLEGRNKALTEQLEELKQELSELKQNSSQTGVDLVRAQNNNRHNTQRANQYMSEARELKENLNVVSNELKQLGRHFTPEQLQSIKERYPTIGRAMEKGREQERSQSKGRGL